MYGHGFKLVNKRETEERREWSIRGGLQFHVNRDTKREDFTARSKRETGRPDLGEFSPRGRLFALGSCMKITGVAHIFGLLDSTVGFMH
jgi:hypothetical protein